jgi:hypothetical protein
MRMEIPPWNAVHRERNRRIGTKQRCDGGGNRSQCRPLYRHQHDVLRAEIGGIIARAQLHGDRAVRCFHAQPIGADRVEMRTARDDGDLGATLRQEARQVTADRAGAEDAEPHCVCAA